MITIASRLVLIAAFALPAFTPVQASCIEVSVRKEGNVCRAYVSNYCGQPMRCYVQVEGYAGNGRLYRENGTIRVNNGGQSWYGISGVAACGSANANCQRQ